jgi:hypothetical protein
MGLQNFVKKLSNHCLTTNVSVGLFEAEEEILIITFFNVAAKIIKQYEPM